MDIQWLLQMPQEMKASGKGMSASLALKAGDLLTASVLGVEKGNDALLAFGGFKAYARLPLPVVSGQEVQIRVQAADEGLRMVLVSPSGPSGNAWTGERLEIRLFEPVSDKPFLSTHSRSLVPGEFLQGRVTGFEKDGLMLVDFGKFKAFAKIDIPVQQGQIIPLQVVKNDNGIALTVAPRVESTGATNLTPATMANISSHGRTDESQQASVVLAANHLRSAPVAVPGVGTPVGKAVPSPIPSIAPHVGSGDQIVVNPQSSTVPPAKQAQMEIQSSPAAGKAIISPGSSAPPTGTDMAVLREQVQQLLHETARPEKAAAIQLPVPMKTALVNLQQALNPASTAGDMTTLVSRVREFVENSGLYFEKRLETAINILQDRPTPMTPTELASQPAVHELMVKDLKPNILILKQFLDTQTLELQGADRHMLETLKSVTQRAVTNIEQQQFMATEKPVDSDLFQAFSHLMFLTDMHRNAQLKVYYAKKGRDDAHKNPRISLLLDMDRIGTVRTDLWMVGRDLNITFFVQEPEIKAAIETSHHRIGEMLKDTFNTVAVSVVVNDKKIAEFEGEDLTMSDRRQVDLSI